MAYGPPWWHLFLVVWTMLRCAFTDDRESTDPLHATLRRMAALDRYNTFLFDQIRENVGQRVLEVGAGTGTITQFLRDRDRVMATDVATRATEGRPAPVVNARAPTGDRRSLDSSKKTRQPSGHRHCYRASHPSPVALPLASPSACAA